MFERADQRAKDAQRRLVDQIDENWALVTAGTEDRWNTMTIGWGSAGTLWKTPVVTIYVHPRRYTHQFLLESDWFTIQLFGPEHRRDLGLLGAKSGRDLDKVALTSLTPMPCPHGMTFEEAEVTLVCRKIYTHTMDLDGVPSEVRDRLGSLYETDAHTVFVGELATTLTR